MHDIIMKSSLIWTALQIRQVDCMERSEVPKFTKEVGKLLQGVPNLVHSQNISLEREVFYLRTRTSIQREF